MDKMTPLRQIMTKSVLTVGPNDKLFEVKKLFDQHAIRHIPVINEQREILGIISKEDFLRIAYGASLNTAGRTYTERWYHNLMASEIMTKSPIDLDPEDNVGLAADVFIHNPFHAIPITENGKLVGIVTSRDLLRFAFKEQKVIKEN